MNDSNEWRTDKKVPLLFLLTLMVHTMAAIWFASRLNARVESLEAITRDNSLVLERLVRVETQLDGVKETMNRIDRSIAEMADRGLR
jgi:hypothetical protein